MKFKGHRPKVGTFLIHGHARTRSWDYSHHIIPPLSSSVAYRLGSAERGAEGFEALAALRDPETKAPIYIYDRLDEPSRSLLEDLLVSAEHGEIAVCFATGMAAISAAFGVLLKTGDELISHKTIYGCTYSLMTNWLPRYGIKVHFMDLTNVDALKRALTPQTKAVYFESPSNPTLQLVDIAAVSEVVHAKTRNTQVVVDNTFATPFGQRPLTMGADMVVHSLTKGISGFGTDMGGVVITRKAFFHDLFLYRKDFGGVLSPKAAWPILVYGLPTLALRLKTQQATALTLAKFLEGHHAVREVRYPGLSSFPQRALARRQMVDEEGVFSPGIIVYFLLKGTRRTTVKFLNRIAKHAYSITLAVSLGQIRTLVEYPALMTHSMMPASKREHMGLDETGIRCAVGLEDPDDLLSDLRTALKGL